MEVLVQLMKTRPVTDEEWEEFQEYMAEYYKNKAEKREKFKQSLLYSIYSYVRDKFQKPKNGDNN